MVSDSEAFVKNESCKDRVLREGSCALRGKGDEWLERYGLMAWDLSYSKYFHAMWSWSHREQVLQQKFERFLEDWCLQ